MVIVDPFLVPIPEKYRQSKAEREYHERLIRTIGQLRQRSGGAVDGVSENSTRESYPWIIDDPIQENIELNHHTNIEEVHYHFDSPFRAFNAVSTNTSYTANNWDWINAKNGAPITLPLYPEVNSEVIVRNGGNKRIDILGNGRKINDKDCLIIYKKGNSVKLKFFVDDNQWFGV
jgi:hypothetical protein